MNTAPNGHNMVILYATHLISFIHFSCTPPEPRPIFVGLNQQ